jgi:mannose-1-phosphate guanylyltransferase / mannose-6-phosphate isomerase
MTVSIIPVLMSGGSGTRLWPLSIPAAPKQFHALATHETMIQATALRFQGDIYKHPVVICGEGHLGLAQDQLAALNIIPQAFILEPSARNTAAVAAVAALYVQDRAPEALILLSPADHVITRPDQFNAIIKSAMETAKSRIVTFGIRPSGPETGFGYIHRGQNLTGDIYEINRFLEKPELKLAQAYVDDGGYDWNAGIFLFSPKVMIEELELYAPEVLMAAQEALTLAHSADGNIHLDAEAFGKCPSISIDYAVMEPTKRAAVAPCDIGWADVGGFHELWRLGEKDEFGNHVLGQTLTLDAHNCLIRTDGPPVAVIGLDNIMVISTASGLIVAPLSRAQDVKLAANAFKTVNP